MPADTLLILQASVTKTATFSGVGVSLGSGVAANQTLIGRVIFSAASTATSTATFTFTIDGSQDNVNFATVGGAGFTNIVNLTTTASSGELFIPFNVRSQQQTLSYVRLTATLVLVGTTPTITYQGDIVIAYP